MIDVLSIASSGYLSKYKQPLSIATDGYLSIYALVVIEVDEIIKAGRSIQTIGDPLYKKKVLQREDNEILEIIQIFMLTWD